MIKYKKPISVSKKFQYGGTATMGADYAPDILEWFSGVWEGFKDWNRASAASTGRAVSKAIPKVTPIARTASKVAGPIGIASMIMTPAQTNVGEDEWMRKLRSASSLADFASTESAEEQAEEQASESATEEGVTTSTVSNPQENPPEDPEEEKSEKPRLSMRTIGKVFWETPKHHFKWLNDKTYTSPGVRNMFIRVPAYGWGISTAGGAVPAVKNSGQYIYNKLINPPGPTTRLDSLRQKKEELQLERETIEAQRELDSIQGLTQPKQPTPFVYSDTTQNKQLQDSVARLEEKIKAYGL